MQESQTADQEAACRKWIPWLIVVAIAIAYHNSFAGVFLLDDELRITGNPNIGMLWPFGPVLRFVVDLTFKANYQLGGLKAADYHAVNLLVHIAAALALYGVVRRTLMMSPCEEQHQGPEGAFLAAVCATVWAVHPLQTQSVTYICQRYEAMAGLFLFLMLYCFVRARDGRSPPAWYAACSVACFLGTGTKEIMVIAPLVILLYDYTFVSPDWTTLVRARWGLYLALLLSWAFCAGLLAWDLLRGTYFHGNELGFRLSAGQYLLAQPGVILHYLRLAAYPVPLCIDYAWSPVESLADVIWPGIPLAALLLIAVWALRKRRPAGFLGVAFFVILSPTSGLLPLDDIAFEHRMYTALAAVVCAAVIGGHKALRRTFDKAQVPRPWRIAIHTSAPAVIVIVLATLTVARNRDYHSPVAMWRQTVSIRPANLRARNLLAVALCERGAFDEAVLHFEFVLKQTKHVGPLGPPFPEPSASHILGGNSDRNNRFRALANMGLMAFKRERYDVAISRYVDALRVYPYRPMVRQKMRQALEATGVSTNAVEQEIGRLLWDAASERGRQ